MALSLAPWRTAMRTVLWLSWTVAKTLSVLVGSVVFLAMSFWK